MKRFLVTAALVGLGVAVQPGGTASADVIGIDDFSGNETVIDFTDVDMKSLDNPADIGFGVTVLNSGGGTGGPGWRGNTPWSNFFDNIPGASLGKALADRWGASDLTYNLSEGVRRFGLLLSTGDQTTWTVSFFDTNDELIATTQAMMPAPSDAVFIGFESNTLIWSINITDEENGQITLMDDVRFEVIPSPGPLALLGVAGLIHSRRRRK